MKMSDVIRDVQKISIEMDTDEINERLDDVNSWVMERIGILAEVTYS